MAQVRAAAACRLAASVARIPARTLPSHPSVSIVTMCACGMRAASKNRSAVVVAIRVPREAKLTAFPS